MEKDNGVPRGFYPEGVLEKICHLSRALNIGPVEAVEMAIDYFWEAGASPPPQPR